jgi:hypothetical protein
MNTNNEILYGVPYWACGFETNPRKINSYQHTTFMYRKEPVFGVVVLSTWLDGEIKACKDGIGMPVSKHKTNDSSYIWKDFYFVPFKKNYKGDGKNWADKDLAFSKSVDVKSREYANTYEECVKLYNELIDNEVNKHKEIIKELENYKIKKGN